ncbi:alpha-galactosidase [Paenibacillus sp.]|uniref:alpha-galactosidase n=1 Tax=Paenibacillus sp. TaxID=58172 RepID=UPI0028AFBFCA|nr:alpha-galactosidase [Paenibacillus sp.]
MSIQVNEEHQLFLLTTKNMCYGIGVDNKGQLLHTHWGEKVKIEDCIHLLQPYYHSHFDAEVDREREEYSPWGGLSFTDPALKVKFHDGVRDLKLQYKSYSLHVSDDMSDEGSILEIHLQDAYYSLDVNLTYKVIAEFDLIERKASLTNKGTEPIQLEIAQSAVWSIPALEAYRMVYVTGKWQEEFQIKSCMITEGKKVIESRRGITSHHANPWFAVDNGAANETSGAVWFGSLAWSGNWKITTEKTAFGNVRIVGGINDFDFEWSLKAGETFETPAFIGGYTAEGFGGMSRRLHGYQLKYIMPSSKQTTYRKILYNSWEATEFNVSVREQTFLAQKAAEIGIELFIIDDGWFGKRNHDKAGLGDWYVNTDKFPNGLGELIERINTLGMDFGLWVEPEMVNPDSELYRSHPDWIYHFPNRESSLARNQLVLNLSKPEVKTFILDFMTKLLQENNIKFIKWDMNRAISEPGGLHDPAPEQREFWVRHVLHLYEIWDELRTCFPDVTFETCSSGGGRVDFGMLRYADQAWVSDNTDAFDRLKIQEGFSYTYSAQSMMCWVTDSPGHANHRSVSLKYRFHSAMMGSLGIGGDLNKWTDAELIEAKELVALYKELRPMIQQGKQYRLHSPRTEPTTAVQYVNDDGSESVIFVFLHSQQFGNFMPRLRLNGLQSDQIYQVELAEPFTMSGSGLMSIGIPIALGGDFDSVLIRVRAVG